MDNFKLKWLCFWIIWKLIKEAINRLNSAFWGWLSVKKWVWSGNTTITYWRPTLGTVRKSHRTFIVTIHLLWASSKSQPQNPKFRIINPENFHTCMNSPTLTIFLTSSNFCHLLITFANSLDPDLVGWFCCFTSQVNSYGNWGTVSSPNHTFSWAGLNKRLTSNSWTYFRL